MQMPIKNTTRSAPVFLYSLFVLQILANGIFFLMCQSSFLLSFDIVAEFPLIIFEDIDIDQAFEDLVPILNSSYSKQFYNFSQSTDIDEDCA